MHDAHPKWASTRSGRQPPERFVLLLLFFSLGRFRKFSNSTKRSSPRPPIVHNALSTRKRTICLRITIPLQTGRSFATIRGFQVPRLSRFVRQTNSRGLADRLFLFIRLIFRLRHHISRVTRFFQTTRVPLKRYDVRFDESFPDTSSLNHLRANSLAFI